MTPDDRAGTDARAGADDRATRARHRAGRRELAERRRTEQASRTGADARPTGPDRDPPRSAADWIAGLTLLVGGVLAGLTVLRVSAPGSLHDEPAALLGILTLIACLMVALGAGFLLPTRWSHVPVGTFFGLLAVLGVAMVVLPDLFVGSGPQTAGVGRSSVDLPMSPGEARALGIGLALGGGLALASTVAFVSRRR
ncbi:hypothetical protein ACPYO6_00360 [Georgenia sp. Z1344]|uniref:hypothetical protein n=1 Tax=Georgenia sp. Z1344 TaxID=3416706 RepID=UPI003CF3F02D